MICLINFLMTPDRSFVNAEQDHSIIYLFYTPEKEGSCQDMQHGYTCHQNITQLWGQYSPYFNVHEAANATKDVPVLRNGLPENCSVVMLSLLARHGARRPTAHRCAEYQWTVEKLQYAITNLVIPKQYDFIRSYNFDNTSEELTELGRIEMQNLGEQLGRRYGDLLSNYKLKDTVFVRASGSERVEESAREWLRGIKKVCTEPPASINYLDYIPTQYKIRI